MDRMDLLKATDLLADVSLDLLTRISEALTEMRVKRGETLVQEGDAGDAAFLVVEGRLAIEKDGIVLLTRGAGEWVGEFALIDDAPRSTFVKAATNAVLLRWDRENFQKMIGQSSEVAYGIARVLLAKLREDVSIQVETAKDLRDANERLERENRSLKVQVKPEPQVISQSPRMQEVLDLAWKVADSPSTVLLRGESGTGKEVIARAIHRHSPVGATGPFVSVHCASLSATLLESELFGHEKGAFTGASALRQGRFELADGGTLFLDEVGEIEPEVQVKLLRVLQERAFERVGGSRTLQVNVRLIAATNRNLEEGVRTGRFREDLYYRLNVIPIVLLPLRERREDIPLLVTHFLGHYCKEMGRSLVRVADGAMDRLQAYDWPGNVRELQNLMERIVVVGDGKILLSEHLPVEMRGVEPTTPKAGFTGGFPTLAEVEQRHVETALVQCNWNQSQAAHLLGVSRDQLRNRVKRFGIQGEWKVGAPARK
ncbi:MAG: sigma 54-interacting transcriptional regulator [bacterium]|nr:sigma 54-interacting transcriptional regulator [bacterium]